MSKIISVIVAALFAAVSVSAIAASHVGAQDKKGGMEKGSMEKKGGMEKKDGKKKSEKKSKDGKKKSADKMDKMDKK